MKQDFLKIIENCNAHEPMCDESVSAKKIYNNVMGKVSSPKKRKKTLFLGASGLAATVAIFCMILSPEINKVEVNRNITQFQDKNNNSIEENNNTGVVFCVYEAKQREQPIMANYMNVMKKREVKNEKKIVLGVYDPLSNTAPGYPVIITNSKENQTDVSFSIATTQGQLLQWNEETGDIKELGKISTLIGNGKLFWSPLKNGKSVEKAKIEVNLFIKNKLEDTVIVEIVMEKDGTYTAKRIKKYEEDK